MNTTLLINNIANDVKSRLTGEGSGHDWWHVYRVWKMAQHIGANEHADMLVVELSALLHDVADWKFHGGDETVGPKIAKEIMTEHNVADDIISRVAEIISTISFKGAKVKSEVITLEGKIVQDADRLDAIGATGIARTFAYGGHVNRVIYDPAEKPVMHDSKEAYIKNGGTTVNHFYEKLLLLKDLMNTSTAKQIAENRHRYMEDFLARFYEEWEGRM